MSKHKNYHLLNLIGYGLAKYDASLIQQLGFKTKTDFYKYVVKKKIAETTGVVKNRQDLFDPLFEDSKRRGWWQKGNTYIHRKEYIDTLFGDLTVSDYADMLGMRLLIEAPGSEMRESSPIWQSSFKQMQLTGREAEQYFINNYKQIALFSNAKLSDARLLGDGYDFQLQTGDRYYLAEVKGVSAQKGSIRFTENEYKQAKQYKNNYGLVVVSNLIETPKMNIICNPADKIKLTKQSAMQEQISYCSAVRAW